MNFNYYKTQHHCKREIVTIPKLSIGSALALPSNTANTGLICPAGSKGSAISLRAYINVALSSRYVWRRPNSCAFLHTACPQWKAQPWQRMSGMTRSSALDEIQELLAAWQRSHSCGIMQKSSGTCFTLLPSLTKA